MDIISDFNADVFKYGLQRSHSFEVEITLPGSITNNLDLDKLRIRAEFTSINTPVLTVARYRHGNTYIKAPIEREFEQLSIGFLPDRSLSQHHILSKWLDQIVKGHHITQIQYYDTYLGDIKIHLFDNSNNITSSFQFYEVFPINLTQLDVNKTVKDDVARFGCAFIYSDMKVINKNESSSTNFETYVPDKNPTVTPNKPSLDYLNSQIDLNLNVMQS